MRCDRRRLVLTAALCTMPTVGQAVSPVTPKLEGASRLMLVRALGAAGIDEIGSSAVLNSVLMVLGSSPAAREYRYDEPYPQLPDVDAKAAAAGLGCAEIDLVAHPKATPGQAVTVRGTYCLSDPAGMVWSAREVSVRAKEVCSGGRGR